MSNASYQKLKDKISKLEKDINTLVFHPESYEANLIRARKGFKRDTENAILSGERKPDLKTGGGILDQYQKERIEKLIANRQVFRETPRESTEAFTQ